MIFMPAYFAIICYQYLHLWQLKYQKHRVEKWDKEHQKTCKEKQWKGYGVSRSNKQTYRVQNLDFLKNLLLFLNKIPPLHAVKSTFSSTLQKQVVRQLLAIDQIRGRGYPENEGISW